MTRYLLRSHLEYLVHGYAVDNSPLFPRPGVSGC